MIRTLALAALLLGAFASPLRADNAELRRLAVADQADRAGSEGEWDDDARRRRVLELLATGAVQSPRDRLHAALILQHTPAAVCDGKLTSASAENYLLAHHLAHAAFEAGLAEAGSLVAVTIDRYLSFTEGRQRYGTNRLVDLASGEMYLPEIDRTVSDEARSALGIAPLDELLKAAPERSPAVAAD